MALLNFFKKLFQKSNQHLTEQSPLLIPDLNNYFEKQERNGYALKQVHLGDLYVPTGHIIACDPLVSLTDFLPFEKKVKPGTYAVIAAEAKMEDDDRFAAVKVVIKNEMPTKWIPATVFNDPVDSDEIRGYPVDAGLGCFCDAETQKYYAAFEEAFYTKNPDGNIFSDYLEAEFQKNAKDPANQHEMGMWLNLELPNRPHNVIMFQSGFGDGVYACYWGLNEANEICSLAVDFNIL